jgi:hypothetical protein
VDNLKMKIGRERLVEEPTKISGACATRNAGALQVGDCLSEVGFDA